MASPSTYLTVATITTDAAMVNRVTACAYEQARAGSVFVPDPAQWVTIHRWEWAASPGWADKWEYALAAGNPDPGADGSVITDGDILATVQYLVPPPEQPTQGQ